MSLKIKLAQSVEDFTALEFLIRQYVDWLDLDLTFQSYQSEIEDLALKYEPPASGMFLARLNDIANVGCCGFTPLRPPGACEMKRLFVLPEARGRGIAKSLLSAVISKAEEAGYVEMFLDTLPTMTSAIRLYEALCFERVEPYYDNPITSALFFRRELNHGSPVMRSR